MPTGNGCARCTSPPGSSTADVRRTRCHSLDARWKPIRSSIRAGPAPGWPRPASRSLGIGILHAAGDSRGQAQEILGVPCVDSLGLGLERAVAEDRVVNRAAGETTRGGRFRHLKILLRVESDQRQPLPDVAEEEQRFVAADAALARHAGQGGVDLGEAVRAAAGVFFPEAQEEIDAGRMMLMIRVKRGDEHGGIEKRLHWLSPAFRRWRCARMVRSVSSVSPAVSGLPVRNTQTPRSFCRGVAPRLGRKVTSSPLTVRSRVSPGERCISSRRALGRTTRPARSRVTLEFISPFYYGFSHLGNGISASHHAPTIKVREHPQPLEFKCDGGGLGMISPEERFRITVGTASRIISLTSPK